MKRIDLAKILILGVSIVSFVTSAVAQRAVNSTIQSAQSSPTNAPRSSLDTTNIEIAESRNTFFSIFNGNPGKAAFYSLVIPAGGQIYNKKWLKVPLALGLDGAAVGWIVYNKTRYNEYDGIFRDLLVGKPNEFFSSPADVNVLRRAYKSRVEYAWVYFGIAHLITVFDAFVDRHLIEFDIDNDIVYHSPLNTANAFEIVSIKIPLSNPSYNKKPKIIYLAK